MENLNTMKTFLKGFNIVRNGEVITLTPAEMSRFRYLDNAITGQTCLELYKEYANDEDKNIIEEMMNDEETCYDIESDILDIVYNDIGAIETDVIDAYIKRNKDIKG